MGQGAATSGQGLTALQVAAALKAAATVQVERSGDASATVRRTTSGIEAYSKTIRPEDCSKTLELTVSAPGKGGATTEVHITEYAPDVFSFLRRIEGVSEEWFAREWSLPEERLRMELGEGRSQALFLKSKTMAFMCKTIAEEEVHVLLQVLRDFTLHIATNPNSVLMRFYLLMKVTVGKEMGYILCFNDVFGAASVLHEKWDIKGRVPKPGKYLYYPHLIRHAYEPDPYLIQTPHSRDVIVDTHEEGKDDTTNHDAAVVLRGAEDTVKLSTLHDKDLTRLFWLPQDTRKRLLQQLFKDYNFLMKAGLMDYSLLIGVAYQENKTSRSGKKYVIENMKMCSPPGEPHTSPRAERRPSSPDAKASGDFPDVAARAANLSEFVRGVHSLYDQEIYYIGIIDVLTAYSAKKKAANFFKSFLWEQDTLSTIPPKQYGRRITSFTKLIFPEVEDEDGTK
jgi:hypothetical protein